MQRADTIERLRRVYAILRDEGKFTSADAVCCAIAEIERLRAANVGANEGQWQPIETAPKHGPFDDESDEFLIGGPGWRTVVWGWSKSKKAWVFGTDHGLEMVLDRAEPTHWRPLPDAPKRGAECGVNPPTADNLEAPQ